jgi:hypothetical protein
MAATFLALIATRRRGWFGLVERVYYAEMTVWIFLVAQMLSH